MPCLCCNELNPHFIVDCKIVTYQITSLNPSLTNLSDLISPKHVFTHSRGITMSSYVYLTSVLQQSFDRISDCLPTYMLKFIK